MSCIKSIRIVSIIALGIYSSSSVFADSSFINDDHESTIYSTPCSQVLKNLDEQSIAMSTLQTDDLSDLADITSLLNESKNVAIETPQEMNAQSSSQSDIKNATFSGVKVAAEKAQDVASYGAYGAKIAAEQMWDLTADGVKFAARKTWDLTSYTANKMIRNGIAWNLCYYFSEGLEEGVAIGLREGVRLVYGGTAGQGAYVATKLALKAAHYVVPGFRGLFAATSMGYARVAVVDPAIKVAPSVATTVAKVEAWLVQKFW